MNDWKEDSSIDFKSLRQVIGKTSDVPKLAETCVSFANAQGGIIVVGIEDKQSAPPSNQKIDIEEVNKVISRLRDLTDGVGIANPVIHTHENGGQYFSFKILPSFNCYNLIR